MGFKNFTRFSSKFLFRWFLLLRNVFLLSSFTETKQSLTIYYFIRVKKQKPCRYACMCFSFREINEIAVVEISMLAGREEGADYTTSSNSPVEGEGFFLEPLRTSSYLQMQAQASECTWYRYCTESEISCGGRGELFREPLMTRVLLPPSCPP